MIINIEEIFKKLSNPEDWEPVEFINDRREMLRFEQVATIDLNDKRYAYMYEIDDEGDHLTDFPAVVEFEDLNGEYFLDFVTDQNLISDVAYEVIKMRREGTDVNDESQDDLYDEADLYDDDDLYDEFDEDDEDEDYDEDYDEE